MHGVIPTYADHQEKDSMSITHKTSRGLLLLGACLGMAMTSGNALAAKKFEPLNEADFEKAVARPDPGRTLDGASYLAAINAENKKVTS